MRRALLLPLLALCLLPGLALAGRAVQAKMSAPKLDCPDSAGLGEPFVVRLRLASAPKSVSLTWLARRISLTGRSIPGRPGSPGSPGGWETVALLGTDVGNTSLGRHGLVVRLGGKGGRVMQKSIAVLPVKRPVESLELDPAMVTPPAEAYPRIQAERQQIQGLLAGLLERPAKAGVDGRNWSLPLARPVPGEVSSIYGIGRILNGQRRAPHRGLDMEAETGEPVLAAADGTVLFSGPLYYAGNAVYLDHGQGLATSYFHLSQRRVETGAHVARGQVLGLAGATGRSTRSHLHFGVWALGRLVDPEPLFLYGPLP